MTLKDFLEVDSYPEDPVVLHIYMGDGRYQTFYSYVKDFTDVRPTVFNSSLSLCESSDDNRFYDCDVNDYGDDHDYGCRYIMCDGLETVDYGDIYDSGWQY